MSAALEGILKINGQPSLVLQPEKALKQGVERDLQQEAMSANGGCQGDPGRLC